MNLTCYLVGLQSIVDIMSSSLCDKKRWQEIVTGLAGAQSMQMPLMFVSRMSFRIGSVTMLSFNRVVMEQTPDGK